MLFNKPTAFLSCLLTVAVVDASTHHGSSGHGELARRYSSRSAGSGDVSIESHSETTSNLTKRATPAHFSWYDTEESGNPGSCGQHIKNSEWAVARYIGHMNKASDCFKRIRIFHNGKTAEAVIKDSCPGCHVGGFDLSKGLFQHFYQDAYRQGVFDGEWEWADGSGSKPVEPQKPQPPSSKPPPKPSTTWVPPPPPSSSSSLWRAPSSTLSSASRAPSSTSSSRSSRPSSSGLSTSFITLRPTASPVPQTNNLQGLNNVVLEMASLAIDGKQSQ